MKKKIIGILIIIFLSGTLVFAQDDLWPPTNLVATDDLWEAVDLNWDAPVDPTAIELYYDDGEAEHYYYVDYPPASTHHIAVGFTYPEDCWVNVGRFLVKYDSDATSFDYNLFGGTASGPDASIVLASGTCTLDGNPDGDWYDVDLGGIAITAGNWFYLDVQYRDDLVINTNCYYVGGDVSEPDPYSWYTLDEITWNNLGIFVDIMLRTVVSTVEGEPVVLNPIPVNLQPSTSFKHKQLANITRIDDELLTKFTSQPYARPKTRFLRANFENYNIYREESLIGTSDIEFYSDTDIEFGTYYDYYVTAQYTEGESDSSNHAIGYAPPFLTSYWSDFEDDDGGLVGDPPTGGWEWGTPDYFYGPSSAYSGVNCWATNLSGVYGNNANYKLETTEELLIGGSAYVLEFWHWYVIEGPSVQGLAFDGGNVKISTDGGSIWEIIVPEGGYPETTFMWTPGIPGEPCYSGESGGWVNAEFDLSAYSGEFVLFRWHFGSDPAYNIYPGWYIDNVHVYQREVGSLEGYVTELSTGTPIEGAIIDCGSYEEGVSGADGYYEINWIPIGTCDVTCEAEGYNDAFVGGIEILVDDTTTVNFEMIAPTMEIYPLTINESILPDSSLTTYLTVSNNGNGSLFYNISIVQDKMQNTDYSKYTGGTVVTTAIESVKPEKRDTAEFQVEHSKEEVIIHYDSDNFAGIGLTESGSFMAAARFTPDELADYYGNYDLTGIQIFVYDASFTNVTLKVWEGGSLGDPGVEVYSEDITTEVLIGDWTTHILTTPVWLVPGNEYWIGYSIDHYVDGYPAGHDEGPAAGGKGDWIYITSWAQLHHLNPLLNYNWNIRGILNTSTTNWIIVQPNFDTVEAGDSSDVAVTFNSTGYELGTALTADIVFTSDPDVGTETVGVILTIGEEDFGSISGTVTLENTPYSTGNIQDVVITAGAYSTSPGEYGNYTLPVYPNTYDVTASLYGYEDSTIEGVVVIEGENTPYIDFDLNCLFGGLAGNVTDLKTGLPIEGAIVTVLGTNPDNDLSDITDEFGHYEINDIIEGIYDVKATYSWYLDIAENIIIAQDIENTQDFILHLPVPRNLGASEDNQDGIMVKWWPPAEFLVEYDIIYDDGIAENAWAYYDEGNMHAVRFTPVSYPCYINTAYINVFTGIWPSGANLQPFEVAVFDDDGTDGLPGTELGRVDVIPTNYNFVEVDLTGLSISIQSGEFYIAHVQGGDYPDCLPIAIDWTLPTVNRSYRRWITGGGDWELSYNQDCMIRATVSGPEGPALLIENGDVVTFTLEEITKEMVDNGNISPGILAHYVEPKTGTELVGNGKIIKRYLNRGTRNFFFMYNLYRSDTSGGPYTLVDTCTTEIKYLDTDIAIGEVWYYVATALYDTALPYEESPYSNEDSGHLHPFDDVPPPPDSVWVEGVDNEVTISWNEVHVIENDIDYYNIYKKYLDCTFEQIGSTADTTYDYILVNGGGGYRFYVTTVDLAGQESEPSIIVQYIYSSGPPVISAQSGLDELVTIHVAPWGTEYTQAFHDGTFESQIGCPGGGGCAFGVRFTPVGYPADLTHLEMTFQGAANCTAAIVSVYLDPDGLIQGPPGFPTGPGDPSAVWESDPMALPPGTYQINLSDAGITIDAGDVYAIVWDNYTGFLGIANDLQMNYIDRNWVYSITNPWETVFDATGADPTLTGNFGITATFCGISGRYLAGFDPVYIERNSKSSEMLDRCIKDGNPIDNFLRTSISGVFEPRTTSGEIRDAVNIVIPEVKIELTRDLTGYKIYKSFDNISFNMVHEIVGGSSQEWDDTDVINDTSYWYYATAIYNGIDESIPSDTVSAIPHDGIAPGPITDLDYTVYVQGLSVDFTWVDPVINEDGTTCTDLVGIEIYRDDELITTIDPGVQTYTDVVTATGIYLYTFIAIDEVSNESESVIAQVQIDYILFSENFSTCMMPPNGWSTAGDFQGNWQISNTNFAGGLVPECLFNYVPFGYVGTSRLVTPEYNTTGKFLDLEFKYKISHHGGPYTFGVATTSNGGVTWNEVWSVVNPSSTYQEFVEVPVETPDVGSENFQLCFCYYGDPYNMYGWNIDDIICFWTPSQTGSLAGTVTEVSTGNPIENATITIIHKVGYSNQYGSYLIEDIPTDSLNPSTYSVTCVAEGYNDALTGGIEILVGETTTLDFALNAPTMEINPLTINETIESGDILTTYITVSNNGNGPLDWHTSVVYPPELYKNAVDNLKDTYHLKHIEPVTSKHHINSFKKELLTEPSRDMWDLQFSFDVTAVSGGYENVGSEFDGTYFYTSRWNSNLFHKYNIYGNLVEEFSVPGVGHLRDLAWDGECLYGAANDNIIYGFNPISHTLIYTILSPINVVGIAYDSDNDAFWCCNVNGDIYLLGRDGSTIDIINTGVYGTYGMAYDNFNGGPYLWVFHWTMAGGPQYLLQLDIDTGEFTGVSHDVMLELPGGGVPGGAFITTEYQPGTVTLGGLLQTMGGGIGDLLFGYELYPYSTPIRVEPTFGTVEAGGYFEVAVILDASLESDTTLYAEIVFTSYPDVGTETVEVTLEVIEAGVQEFSLLENWNWISFNVHPEDTSLDSVFAPLMPDDIFQVMNQTQSATNYSGTWYGSLEEITDGEGYLVKMNNPFNPFILSGMQIESTTPINLNVNWNWIAYYPQYSILIENAMAGIVPNVFQVMNQTQSATYYDPPGEWYGSLEQMEPNIAYKIKMNTADTLIYPEQKAGILNNSIVTRDETKDPPDWEVIPNTQYHMVLMAEITLGGEEFEGVGENMAGAFCLTDSLECRGIATWEEGGAGFWYFDIVSNVAIGEEITFKIYDSEIDMIYACNDTIFFEDLATIGTPFEPYQLTAMLTSTDGDYPALSTKLNSNFPNPFNHLTTISFSLKYKSHVKLSVYNIKGQLVATLVDEEMKPGGNYKIIWDGKNDNKKLANGIYFYKFETKNKTFIKKMLLIR